MDREVLDDRVGQQRLGDLGDHRLVGAVGDVAVGLSTSGSSANVVRALETARELGMVTVALTGASGGKVAGVVDVCIRVPSEDTPRVQELCMLLGHTMCELIEQEVTRPGRPARRR